MGTFDCLGRRRSRRWLSLVTFGLSLGALWCGGVPAAQADTGGYAPPALTIDDASPDPGGPVTLLGNGCEAAATVSFTLEPGTVSLGTTTADADGSYRFTSTFPRVTPGVYTIVATCGPTRTTTEITISSPVPAQLSRTDDPGDAATPIAFTGAQVLGLVATGAGLLALGGAALLYGRRWHRAPA